MVVSSEDAILYSNYNEKLIEISLQLRNCVAIHDRIAGARQALRKIIKEANSKEVDEILDNLSFVQTLLKIYGNFNSDLGGISVDEVVEILKKRAEKVDEDSWRTLEIELQTWTLIIF